MIRTSKLMIGAVCWICAFVAVDPARATLIEVSATDFQVPRTLDFEGAPTGNVTGTESIFADFGLSSINVSASDFRDVYGPRANSSRALWADASGLAIVDPGAIEMANFNTYDLVFQAPLRRFGFGTHDQNDPLLANYIQVSTFLGPTSVGTISLGAGIVSSDLNMFYLSDTDLFDRVVIDSLGNSGFAIDNLVVETPEAGSLWLVGVGLLGVFMWRWRIRRRDVLLS